MNVNEQVYGAKENWYVPSEHSEFGTQQYADVYYYNQIAADDKLKIKIANYNTLESPITIMRSQIDGQYTSESYLIRNNWKPTEFTMDNSIVQFGIGPQSGLSNQEWWYVDRASGASNPSETEPPVLKNVDKYDITNMCLATRSNYAPYEFYTEGRGSILGGYDNNFMYWQRISRQIFGSVNSMFSPDYNSTYGYETGYINTKLVAQIPIKNLKLTPVIYAYNSALDGYKKFTSISDYLAEKSSYPYIFCIKAKFMYRSGINDDIDYNYNFDCYPWFFNPSSFLSGYGYSFNSQNQIYGDVYYPNRGDQETGEGITVAGRPGYAHGPNGSMLGNEIYWYGHYDSATTWDFTIGQGGRVLQTPDFKFVLGTKNLFYCDVSSMTDDQITEGIRTQLASFGMFFVDGEKGLNLALDDDKTFLGILENGVGYGKYSNGKKNREQAQWNWDTMEENTYDPVNPPEPPGPEPDPNPVIPDTPGFSLAVGNGSVCYTITKAEWAQIWDNIYSGGKKNFKALVEGLALYGSNPLNAILNYRWYPFYLNGGDTRPLRLGSTIVKPATNVYHCISSSEQAFTSATGSFIWGRPKNFVNTRKTKARLFLPFYGFYDLPTSLLVNKELEVRFQYSLPDDNGVWFIMFGGSVYDYVECQPFIEIPITGDNSLQIAAAKSQRNLQIAATIGAAVIMAGATILGPTIGAAITAGSEAAWATGGIASGIAANLAQGVGRELITAPTVGAAITGAGALVGAGIKTANNIMQSALKIGTLSTNVPIHGQSSDTTFLHLPKYPYIQIYTNTLIDGFSESEYKWKVGIACDKWGNLASMPEQTLLATTGTANMGTDGMLIDEVKELNDILQSGFYR